MKFANLQSDLEGVFATTDWTDNNIPAIPENLQTPKDATEFVVINIIHGQSNDYYGPDSCLLGMLRVDIFSPAAQGATRAFAIADILDDILEYKVLTNGTQTTSSTLSRIIVDQDNASLFRVNYSIPFKHYT